jgi:hypothetical protein
MMSSTKLFVENSLGTILRSMKVIIPCRISCPWSLNQTIRWHRRLYSDWKHHWPFCTDLSSRRGQTRVWTICASNLRGASTEMTSSIRSTISYSDRRRYSTNVGSLSVRSMISNSFSSWLTELAIKGSRFYASDNSPERVIGYLNYLCRQRCKAAEG